ncbi:recombination-associated protein RdgC [Halioxenophilus sp. WMMB6]|uniref:recombination-associated protein RdgC n=1 Tax=Halioxenophilus sp. WMMB6 TaxID=3073815 RepID=UPI00295E44A4|nr:recombination-associated protein RdgC [Halioxenophilus sp. WMMB6]
MWFKNLRVYRFTKPFTLAPEALAEKLAEQPFHPCGSQELTRIGFVPPLGDEGSELIHSSAGYTMLCCKKQQKVLPAAVVNEALEEKVKALQAEEGRKLGRKERQQLKEELTLTMLPRAFTKSSKLFAYVAAPEGLLIINSASANQAEELLITLRELLGSLPVVPITCRHIPVQVMTNWLLHQQPADGLQLGQECELRDPGEAGGIIRCKNQDLTAANIINHLQEGMYVAKLALIASAGIECIVDENLAIKRLVYGDRIQEKLDQESPETAAQQFDVDFSLMTLELASFLKQLFAAFGGEDLSQLEEAE